MNVSEGHLTQQYLLDYLTIFDNIEESYDHLVLQNMFLYRMSVDGGFHARVVSSILNHEEDRGLLLSLLSDCAEADNAKASLKEWLTSSYAAADGKRKEVLACLLRSHISGTNKTAELFAESETKIPESIWRTKSRAAVIDKIKNSDMYFGAGRRPFWHAFPLDLAAAHLAGVKELSADVIYDAVVCVAGAWFSTLSEEEMIIWLNMPRVTPEEWEKIVRPLLDIADPTPAVSAADWLYASGNYDAALDLYANITLAYAGSEAEKPAFEMMGEILTEFKDFDNAFESYKNAFLLCSKTDKYAIAEGLKNLCITGDDLGEDMQEYYARITRLAEELPSDKRCMLYLSFSAAMRKRRNYANEYRWIEEIVGTEDCPEEIFSAAMNRLSEMNIYLDYSGNPDTEKLSAADSAVEAALAVEKGDFAYFGFDPVCALFWYNRAASAAPELKDRILPKMFSAAVAAGLISDAAGYARGTPALEAVVHAQDADEFALAVNAVNKAVTASLSRGIESAAAVIYPAFLFLSEEKRRSAAEQILESRSTRDDERSRVSLALGSVYLDLGMISAARSMLRAALRANPGSEIRSRILIELAWMESEEGEYKQAVETYRLALKQNERFPAAWAGIAKASIRMGEFEAALSAAKEAVLLNPAEDSYRHMKEALEIVCTEPKSETADKLFCLPGAENTAYAAVLYAEASGLDVAAAWSASSVSDVLAFRI
ncbi:MAG: hypothetical protein E7Z71_04275 [Methanocorpusculum parvum]|nr:hypothetical protein [Methanocorpusculum parvum]